MAEDDRSWVDDEPIYSHLRDDIQSLIDDYDLPSPDHWERYDVFMEPNIVTATITDETGKEYDITFEGRDIINDLEQWDEVWSLWDWLEAEYDDVDLESHYID